MRSIAVLSACAGVLFSLTAASGRPRQIIILRHAEKIDGGDLCPIGERRAEALAKQYLGKGARKSLFENGDQPSAFFAITGHTKDTIKPTAKSWGLEVIRPADSDKSKDSWEDLWTQKAANDVLTDPAYNGKIVVMAWEHNRIANEALPEDVTLRHLLKLDVYAEKTKDEVPKNWCGSNYDWFWIVTYGDPTSETPTKVSRILQAFDTPFDDVPKNKWGAPEPAVPFAGCTETKNPQCEPPQD
jgi:hypothetical protein